MPMFILSSLVRSPWRSVIAAVACLVFASAPAFAGDCMKQRRDRDDAINEFRNEAVTDILQNPYSGDKAAAIAAVDKIVRERLAASGDAYRSCCKEERAEAEAERQRQRAVQEAEAERRKAESDAHYKAIQDAVNARREAEAAQRKTESEAVFARLKADNEARNEAHREKLRSIYDRPDPSMDQYLRNADEAYDSVNDPLNATRALRRLTGTPKTGPRRGLGIGGETLERPIEDVPGYLGGLVNPVRQGIGRIGDEATGMINSPDARPDYGGSTGGYSAPAPASHYEPDTGVEPTRAASDDGAADRLRIRLEQDAVEQTRREADERARQEEIRQERLRIERLDEFQRVADEFRIDTAPPAPGVPLDPASFWDRMIELGGTSPGVYDRLIETGRDKPRNYDRLIDPRAPRPPQHENLLGR